MSKNNTEQEMAEWKEICHKLHLRDETVDGTDEQAMIRNHYLKWFTPKTNNKDNIVDEILKEVKRQAKIRGWNAPDLEYVITEALTEAYQAGVRDVVEFVLKEYGYMNDGCGCCMEERLDKVLTAEKALSTLIDKK